MPAGGRGYTRPASLVSLWSTAPFLLNNTRREVQRRARRSRRGMAVVPGLHRADAVAGEAGQGPAARRQGAGPSSTARRPRATCGCRPATSRLAAAAARAGCERCLLLAIVGEGGIEIGPIPKGTPVNLLANMQICRPDTPERAEQPGARQAAARAAVKTQAAISRRCRPDASDEEARRVFTRLSCRAMLELSKCPDFVVNRGHYFGTDLFKEEPGLSDDDKRALIEFLKTLLRHWRWGYASATGQCGLRVRRRGLGRRRRDARGPPGRGRPQGGAARSGRGPADARGRGLRRSRGEPTARRLRRPRIPRIRLGERRDEVGLLRPPLRDVDAAAARPQVPRDVVRSASTACSTRAPATLGGCTAHNAMIMVYPHNADWDGIAS